MELILLCIVNEYSFILWNDRIMEKLESIRNATIESISRKGLANSSVAGIAKIAGVSDGYLYRHYTSKDDLVQDVLGVTFALANELIAKLLAESRNIEEYIDNYLRVSIASATENPDKFKFLVLLQNDFSFSVDTELVKRMKELCYEILRKCADSGNYRDDLSVEDIYMAFIVVPQQYIKLRFKDEFDVRMELEVMTEKIRKMIISIIK